MAANTKVEPAFHRKALIVIGLLVLALFLWKIAPVLLLAFAGVVFATMIRAAAVPLSRRTGMPDLLAVSIVGGLGLLLLIAAGYLFGQRVTEEANALWTALGDAWTKFEQFVSKFPIGQTAMEGMKSGGTDSQAMAKVAKGTFTVFGAVADVFLVIFLAFYLAADPRTYRRGLMHLVPKPVRERVEGALDASGVALRKWLLGQLAAMLAVGLLTGLGLWAIGVPLAIPLAILSALLDFVPVIGPFIAAFPGVLIAFSQSPELGLYAALVYLAVQFVEGNIVMPLAQKWAVSVPPALSLLGIVAFGVVFGLAGVLFAMPLLVVTMVMVQKLYVDRIER
ncbi:MAG TPA: AI-2E family transporter [Usitatibacter sp.]|nr:AI-2E family transporter [Usitatibacter sp.]